MKAFHLKMKYVI
ncbi:hypothetical protein CGLO_15057 [Colletotrichum gloeosporioides Cg-14]|uniref:Uncharacterized protein n=1 Tax=Colletotrichum gloeosporioides (strain Cg-14) TaxID=1237896 RepID=T0LCE4_COLGC|nr:hypothetical protein CGLO_15057 [Colletotrichum gloeosporioides Cg-14]